MEYTIDEVLSALDAELPSLSPTAGKIMQLANDINCSPMELTKVIKLDPILSVKVMRLVNSSYFNVSQQITALEKAVIMLGLNTIKNLALSAAMMSQLKPVLEKSSLNVDEFWRYSLGVGVTAKMLAVEAGIDKKVVEDYFLSGLIHALGVLIEFSLYPEEAEEIAGFCGSMGLVEAEEYSLCGLNHLKIGAALAEKWGLPENLQEVMKFYNNSDYSGVNTMLVLTVHAATRICRKNGVSLAIHGQVQPLDDSVWQKIGLEPSVEEEIVARLNDEIANATEFLSA